MVRASTISGLVIAIAILAIYAINFSYFFAGDSFSPVTVHILLQLLLYLIGNWFFFEFIEHKQEFMSFFKSRIRICIYCFIVLGCGFFLYRFIYANCIIPIGYLIVQLPLLCYLILLVLKIPIKFSKLFSFLGILSLLIAFVLVFTMFMGFADWLYLYFDRLYILTMSLIFFSLSVNLNCLLKKCL